MSRLLEAARAAMEQGEMKAPGVAMGRGGQSARAAWMAQVAPKEQVEHPRAQQFHLAATAAVISGQERLVGQSRLSARTGS